MIDGMGRQLPQYVYAEYGKRKRPAFYFRRGKGPRIRLPDYGLPGFEEAYLAARASTIPKSQAKAAYGTLEWLIGQYRASADYTSLSLATRLQRRLRDGR